MKDKEITFQEVIESPVFYSKVEKVINDILNSRREAEYEYGQLKRSPIVALNEDGYLETKPFIAAYRDVAFKVRTGMSSSKRRLIQEIGNKALYLTLEYFKTNEWKKIKLEKNEI